MQIKVALIERERFADAQTGAPEHDNQTTQPDRVAVAAGSVYHGNDLLDGRRVSRIALTLVTRRSAQMKARGSRVSGDGRRCPTARRLAYVLPRTMVDPPILPPTTDQRAHLDVARRRECLSRQAIVRAGVRGRVRSLA
jgi:hypothetical protein